MTPTSTVRCLRPATLLLVAAALLSIGCTCGGPTIVDPPDTDAGASPELDGGGPGADAGAPASDAGTQDAGPPRQQVAGFAISVGPDVSAAVRARALRHLTAVLGQAPREIPPTDLVDAADATSLFLALGDTALTRQAFGRLDAATAGDEAVRVKARSWGPGVLLAADGTPQRAGAPTNLGLSMATYTALEALGFGFLHPLQPFRPSALRRPPLTLDVSARPRWKKRELHLHTQHPLELTELLQGWGPAGPTDATGFDAQLPEWEAYCEWLVANRQNGVEWFLLWAQPWAAFADDPARFARLARLVQKGHDFGLAVGLDVPIAFGQQNAFRLVRTRGTLAQELGELRSRVDLVMSAGFDFLGTEAGTSEFTAPEPQRMLDWMNELTRHVEATYGKHVFIKVHASSGQVAQGFPDPVTGSPINFNFLPHFADARLGVLPHTVQHYGLTDLAPTYGNSDFDFIRRFLRQEVGRRPVVWYPETAYWVSFDVDVPLFLPLYAERRLNDLRLIASDEEAGLTGSGATAGQRMDGQLIFSSGWEWGYWLNDVVAARAAYEPFVSERDKTAALRLALAPVTQIFGAERATVEQWLVDTVAAEQALLIEGRVGGVRPNSIARRSGQAYLQGFETWDDVSERATASGLGTAQMTQPARLGLVDMRNPLHSGPGYSAEIEPLLAEMKASFGALSARAELLRGRLSGPERAAFDELADAAKLTALRARQVHGLYDYVDGWLDVNVTAAQRRARLDDARAALDAAKLVVAERERWYRVPRQRIAGWRPNPTSYAYGYLWTVRTLFYWWRDEGKAVDAPVSPCYLNIINPVTVAWGEGLATDTLRVLSDLFTTDERRGCLAEPSSELVLPQDNLRSRP